MTGDSSARVFFCNSGAEANEAVLKLSRLTGKKKVIAFEGGFHGRTMGALSMTGQSDKRDKFQPLIKKIKFAKYNDIKSVARLISPKTAMVIIEPIQGERGVLPAKPGFLSDLRRLTSENGTLLAIDAVQTGMGRTGKWFGYEDENIRPDAITLAKGLGGGLPIGAMIAFGESGKLFQPGQPFFGSCGGLRLRKILDQILQRLARVGEQIVALLLEQFLEALEVLLVHRSPRTGSAAAPSPRKPRRYPIRPRSPPPSPCSSSAPSRGST